MSVESNWVQTRAAQIRSRPQSRACSHCQTRQVAVPSSMSTRRPATSSSTAAENVAQRLSALLVARSATCPRGCAPRDARTTSARAPGVEPPQDSPQAAIGIWFWGVWKNSSQIVDHGSLLPDRSNLSRILISSRLGLKNEQQLERRRLWLRRLRAEGPGGVSLWAARFRYGELPCILLVTDLLVLRACQ